MNRSASSRGLWIRGSGNKDKKGRSKSSFFWRSSSESSGRSSKSVSKPQILNFDCNWTFKDINEVLYASYNTWHDFIAVFKRKFRRHFFRSIKSKNPSFIYDIIFVISEWFCSVHALSTNGILSHLNYRNPVFVLPKHRGTILCKYKKLRIYRSQDS